MVLMCVFMGMHISHAENEKETFQDKGSSTGAMVSVIIYGCVRLDCEAQALKN